MPADPLRIRIVGTNLPGRKCGPHQKVRVGLQVRKDIPVLIDGAARKVVFDTEASLVSGPDRTVTVRGPAIHGGREERFLYLSWVERTGAGKDEMFRRAKLQLDAVPETVLKKAARTGATLLAELELSDSCGMPLCASVRPPLVRWSLVASDPSVSRGVNGP